MVTGVETAGLVLAIFPLVVKGLDVYLDGSRKAKDLLQWSRGLRCTARVLRAESALFENTCACLLEEVVTPKEVVLLMGGEGWDDRDFQETLTEHMGTKLASAFIEAVEELNSCLNELRRDLGLHEESGVSTVH